LDFQLVEVDLLPPRFRYFQQQLDPPCPFGMRQTWHLLVQYAKPIVAAVRQFDLDGRE
jgi:hypothetical protein